MDETLSQITTEEISLMEFAPAEDRHEHYEMLVLIPGQLTEEQAQEVQQQVTELMMAEGAQTTHEEFLGRRALGYTVAGGRHGYYVVVEFDMARHLLDALQRKLRVAKNVARFLIIKKHVKTAEEIACEQEVMQKIHARRLRQQSIVAAKEEKNIRTEEVTVVSSEMPKHVSEVVSKNPVNPAPQPTTAERSATLEDIDKEIDRILNDDMNI